MRKVIDDPRLIYKCCKLYYEEEASQQEIAKQMKLSRVSVCRMLKAGREQGMVVIQVHSPNRVEYGRLERQLEDCFGLKEALVAETGPRGARCDQTTAVSVAASRILESYLAKDDIVGVGLGKLLYGVCSSPRPSSGSVRCTFVPMIGGIGSAKQAVPGDNSTQLAEKLAHLFGGNYMDCFAPAIFSDANLGKQFMAEPFMRPLLDCYTRMHTLIFEIGSVKNSIERLLESGLINEQERQSFAEAKGEIMMQFYDSEGNTDKFHEFNRRVASMPLSRMKTLENRIGLARGERSVQAVYGALQNGYVNILVTDEECAVRLLEMKNAH